MTPDIISLISNIIFFVIIAIVILKGLLGLFKGFWKAINSFVVSIACYLCLLFFNNDIAELIYNFDLSMTNFSFNLQNQTITLTSIGETLRNILLVITNNAEYLTSSPQIFATLDAVVLSFLSFVTLIVGILLVMFVISPLVSLILYHVLTKHIIKKNFREKHPLKVLGFATGGIKALVSCALLISPFTSLTSSISKSVNPYDMQLNESAKQIKMFVDAYDNSMLAKAISAIKVDGNSYDIYLTDYATKYMLDENNSTSFISELNLALNITASGINEGVYNFEENMIIFANVLSESFISTTLNSLAASDLITTLLPVVLTIVSDMDAVKNIADLSQIEWGNIDWSSEFSTIDDIYSQFYDVGIIETYTTTGTINSYELNRKNQQSMINALQGFNNSEFLKIVLPNVIASFAKNITGDFAGVLPTEVSYYQNINIGDELASVYESALLLSDLSRYSSIGKNLSFQDFNQENLTKIMEFVLSSEAIDGYRLNKETNEKEYFYTSDSKETTGYDPMPLSTGSIFFGTEQSNLEVKNVKRNNQNSTLVYRGLLDSNLLLQNMGKLLTTTISYVDFGEVDLKSDIEEVSANLESKEDWQSEIDSLLHVYAVVNGNDKFSFETIDLENEEHIAELKRITPYVNESQLIKKMLPTILKTALGEEDLMFGLGVNDLDFECENLGGEIDKLLDLSLDAKDVQDSISGDNSIDKMLDSQQFDVSKAMNMLETIYNSKLMNPIQEENTLSNFGVIMDSLFAQDSFAEMGFEISNELIEKIDKEDYIARTSKNVVATPWQLEIDAVETVFNSLQSADSMKNMIKGESEEITSLNGDEVEYLLSDMAESRLIEPSIGKILNNYMQQPLVDMNLEVDFENVYDWSIEGKFLNAAITSMQKMENGGIKFSADGIDLAKLNYDNGDGTTGIDDLEEVLTSIYRLQAVRNEVTIDGSAYETNDNFGKFMYENITKSVFSEYINTENEQSVINDHYFALDNDEFYSDTLNNNIDISWDDKDVSVVDYNGEISNIMSILHYVYETEDPENNDRLLFFDYDTNGEILDINIDKALNGDDKQVLENLVLAINKVYPFRTILSDIIDDQISENSSMQMDGINLSKAYSKVFDNEYNYQTTNTEIDRLAENRFDEINVREDELTLLIDIFEEADKVSSATEDGTNNISSFKEITASDAGTSSTVESLLNYLHDSKIFNENNIDYAGETTVFEDIVKYILDKSTLSDMIFDPTNGGYDNYYQESVNGYDSTDDLKVQEAQDLKIYALIETVSSGNENLTWTGENGQIAKLCDLLEYATSPTDDENNNEPIKDEDGNDYEITDLNGIDDLPEAAIEGLLNRMNKSYITHDAVANSVDDIFETVNLNEFILSDTQENAPLDSHTIDKKNISFDEKVDLWSFDISHLVDIYGETEVDENGDRNLNHLVKENDGKIDNQAFSKLLPHLGVMETIKLQRSDIIYSMVRKASLDIYIKEVNAQNAAIHKGSTEEEIDFARRDMITSIININIETDENLSGSSSYLLWLNEGKYMDNLMNHLIEIKSHSLDSDNDETQLTSTDIDLLIGSAYVYDNSITVDSNSLNINDYEAKYDRGYLASEMVVSFIDLIIHELLVEHGEGFTDEEIPNLRRNSTYYGVNEIERVGLMGLLDFAVDLDNYISAISSSDNTFVYDNWVSDATEALHRMGPSEIINERVVYLDGYVVSKNDSVLAETLFTKIVNDHKSEIDAITPNQMMIDVYNSQKGTDYTINDVTIDWDIHNLSFEEKADEWFIAERAPFKTIYQIKSSIVA